MRFPELLWFIVSDSNSDAINWSDTGISIIIDYLKLKDEYLNGNGVFKTNNIASFVRQLNLYGFRKCNHRDDFGNKIHEFQHPLFVEGRKDLMRSMKRKPWSMDEKKHFLKPLKKDFKRPPKIKSKVTPHEPSTDSTIPHGYYQPTTSLEQMKEFWWNNSVFGFSNPSQPWMSPLYHNWSRSILGEASIVENRLNYAAYPMPHDAYYLFHPSMYPDVYRSAMPEPGIPTKGDTKNEGAK